MEASDLPHAACPAKGAVLSPFCAGDWKIDETPLDGQEFDRSTFDMLSK